jgi:hypothetical protein
MSKICRGQAFRCYSGPVLFLVGVCMTLALLFLRVDFGAGWIFIIAAGSALVAFSLLGARGDFGTELESRHEASQRSGGRQPIFSTVRVILTPGCWRGVS